MKSLKTETNSFKIKSKRNVETAIMETNTRTELCVGYSVSSLNTICYPEELEDNNKLIDREYISKIMLKLHLARRILNPVIDEIISTATIMSQTELTAAHSFPLCSLSKEEYHGALRASQIFKDINEELLNKCKNKPLLTGKNFCFPTSKTVVNMVLAQSRSPNRSILEVADRIYIDKDLMLKLIELYEMLGETIRRLREKEDEKRSQRSDQRFQPATASSHKDIKSTSSVRSSQSSVDSDVQTQKSVTLRETVQSGGSRKSLQQVPEEKSVEARPQLFDSIEQAKSQARRCLKVLADVQEYLEYNQEELDLTAVFELIQVPEKDTCDRRGIPHLHALLNNMPVILAYNNGKAKREIIVVSSSTDLLIQSNKSSNCSRVQSKQQSVQNSSSVIVPQTSSTNVSICSCRRECPDEDGRCICREGGDSKYLKLTDKCEAKTTSSKITGSTTEPMTISTGDTDHTDSSSLKLGIFKEIMSSKSDHAISAPQFSIKRVRSVENDAEVSLASTSTTSQKHNGKCFPLSKRSTSKGSYISLSRKSTSRQSLKKNGKTFYINDLLFLTQPPKCCRKSYLNEPLQAEIPYPASLRSLRLDEEDTARITKNIKNGFKNTYNNNNNNNSNMTYFTCVEDINFRVERRVCEVRYFTVKINTQMNNAFNLMQYAQSLTEN